jgi:hypothetical protein
MSHASLIDLINSFPARSYFFPARSYLKGVVLACLRLAAKEAGEIARAHRHTIRQGFYLRSSPGCPRNLVYILIKLLQRFCEGRVTCEFFEGSRGFHIEMPAVLIVGPEAPLAGLHDRGEVGRFVRCCPAPAAP